MHPFRDAQGTITVEMPFPSTWKIQSSHQPGEPTIVGPNGIKVIDFPGQNFLYTSNPRMQQAYYQGGQPLRSMPGVELLIQQDIAPWCAGQGLEFVRHYEVPEVSRIDQWYNEQMYRPVPMRTDIKAIGTEWKHSSGKPYFILMHLVVGISGELQTWYYSCTGLQAEKEHFEAARKRLIFGLANAHYNPQPIMAFNRLEAEKAGRSWDEHNKRMALNQANFEASQRAFVNRANAVNDAIMQGWRDRNAASDRGQEQFIDTITERSKVVDPSTGKQYKVQSGSNQYWMNHNGEYFGTTDSNYNPNLDETMNKENWRELKTVD